MRSSSFRSVLGAAFMMLVGAGALGCDNGGESTGNGGGGSGGEPAMTGGSGGGATTSSDPAGACGAGTELCGDTCTVTALDPDNCGKCGTACGEGESCDGGSCVLECSGGATKCERSCVDTEHDPAHCGACGKACDAEQEVCAAGACVPACGDSGLSKCGDTCTDLMSDAASCGACGKACEGAESCVAGQCVAPVPPKAVYTMTNDAAGNKILTFTRAADGSLSSTGVFTATGGLGTGAGLGNQHGLIFDQATSLFFAVNAGDDSLSMLSLELDGTLKLRAHVPSGGLRPVSVTVSGDVVYAVNAGLPASGAAANISGFKIAGDSLLPIAGSTQPLSAANPGPAQIQFSPDGKVLVVTEKATNVLSTYVVSPDGVAAAPTVKASAGMTPFGFDFSANSQVIVSEAQGGVAGASSTSSYALAANGALSTVSGAVATTRSAACWLVVAGDYAYVANAGTNDITGFKIAADGSLSLLDPGGITGQTTMGATDEDVTDDNDFLYVVNNGAHVFSIFQINADGSLSKKPDFMGIPTAVSGIVAR